MTFAYPWIAGLVIFTMLLSLFKKKKELSIIYSNLKNLESVGSSWRIILRNLISFLASLVTIISLTIAGMRPQHIEVVQSEESARNLMLALDISGSMRTRDFTIDYRPASRLEAVKLVVSKFIEQRPNERLGLVVFGSSAFLECPLTNDHSLLSSMVKQLQVGLAGDGTALGDGLGVSIKRISELSGDSKAIILMTDGVNTAGTVNPIQAAKIAKEFNIKVHTVGIGSSRSARNALNNPFIAGSTKQYEFDEKMLKEIANLTGGVYFNAENIEQLEEVYGAIDQLEKTELETPKHAKIEELYSYYALIGLVAYSIYLLTTHFIFPSYPW
jgi:Ca-activated chloride channel family protein